MSQQYRINKFARRIGRAPSTVRCWERVGKRLPSDNKEPTELLTMYRMY